MRVSRQLVLAGVPVSGAALVAVVLLVADAPPAGILTLLASASLVAAVLCACSLLLPQRRLPPWGQACLGVAYVVDVTILRLGTGGLDSPFTALLLLPLLWVPQRGGRRSTAAVLAAAAGSLLVPLAPRPWAASPAELAAILPWLAMLAATGWTTTRLVERLADQEHETERRARAADEHARHLRASEQQLRLIMETAQEAFISIDVDGRITAWNAEAERTFGWARSEVMGRPLTDTLVPERHRERHLAGFRRFLETGEGRMLHQRVEIEARHRDGHELPVELTISPVRRGDWYSINCFLHDIAPRRRREQSLRAHSQVTRQLCVATSLDEAAGGLLRTLCATLGWQVGLLWVVDESSMTLDLASMWQDPHTPVLDFERMCHEITFTPEVGVPGRVWQELQPQWISDISRERSFLRGPVALREGLRCAVLVPAVCDGSLTALLELYRTETTPPDDELMQVLVSIAGQVAQYQDHDRLRRRLSRFQRHGATNAAP